jgi:hypothetical protein
LSGPDASKPPQPETAEEQASGCACNPDPFADLPPELRPAAGPRMGGLRQVTCPGCGLEYWTNRAGDLCIDCERSGRKAGEASSAARAGEGA